MKRTWVLTTFVLLAVSFFGVAAPDPVTRPTIRADVVYGHKDGMALTFDVISPKAENGAAIVWIQSGGWYSRWVDPKVWLVAGAPWLSRGYTLFIVRHGSAPRYAIPDAVADVRRSIRFLRLHAREFRVDPDRIGVLGGSAGGHLALMLGTTADGGNPDSKDPVLQKSDRVAAVVALYPPTDLRGWVKHPPGMIGKIPALKPPLHFDPRLEPAMSPVLHASAVSAPTLLVHGDHDPLVPIENSRKMLAALEKAGAPAKLVVVKGGGHGFKPAVARRIVVPAAAKWFGKYLLERAEPNRTPVEPSSGGKAKGTK